MSGVEVLKPMQGIRIWKNPKNRFTVFEIHYSADEDKTSAEWKAAAKSGMPRRQWEQEYEIKWHSYEGLPVYGDWNKTLHESPFVMEAHVGLPLLIGWDFGLCAAAIVGQLQGSKLCILKEFTSMNMGAERFSTYVVHQLRQLYPQWADRKRDWLCWIDPSGQFRKDTDEGTCARVLDNKGFSPMPGPVAWEARRGAVEAFLCRMTKEGPSFQVNTMQCPVLSKGFEGGYRYPKKATELEQTILSPLKNMYSHVHDALQYLCWGVATKQHAMRRSQVPKPSYGFQKG